ncbi:unnamed protein product, partial [Ostreobium quekettii]
RLEARCGGADNETACLIAFTGDELQSAFLNENSTVAQVAEVLIESDSVAGIAAGLSIPSNFTFVRNQTFRNKDPDVKALKAIALAAYNRTADCEDDDGMNATVCDGLLDKLVEAIVLAVHPLRVEPERNCTRTFRPFYNGTAITIEEILACTEDSPPMLMVDSDELRAVLSNRTLMRAVRRRDARLDTSRRRSLLGFLRGLLSPRSLKCADCDNADSYVCAYCWQEDVCSVFYWCMDAATPSPPPMSPAPVSPLASPSPPSPLPVPPASPLPVPPASPPPVPPASPLPPGPPVGAASGSAQPAAPRPVKKRKDFRSRQEAQCEGAPNKDDCEALFVGNELQKRINTRKVDVRGIAEVLIQSESARGIAVGLSTPSNFTYVRDAKARNRDPDVKISRAIAFAVLNNTKACDGDDGTDATRCGGLLAKLVTAIVGAVHPRGALGSCRDALFPVYNGSAITVDESVVCTEDIPEELMVDPEALKAVLQDRSLLEMVRTRDARKDLPRRRALLAHAGSPAAHRSLQCADCINPESYVCAYCWEPDMCSIFDWCSALGGPRGMGLSNSPNPNPPPQTGAPGRPPMVGAPPTVGAPPGGR